MATKEHRHGIRAFSLALALQLVPAAQDDGRGWRWAELELEVWIEPDLASVHLIGSGRLVLEVESSVGPMLELNGKLLDFAGVDSPGVAVELGARHEKDHRIATVRLRLAEPAQRGDELRVSFECQSIGQSEQFAVSAKAALASWTQAWYPLPFNGPDASLSRVMAAPGVTRFYLPAGWQSVSNGAPESPAEPPPEGLAVEVWRVTQPVARSFACAPFTTVALDVDGRAVGVHRLRSAREPADVELGAIAAILRALETRYGTYPYPGYRVAEVPDGVGEFLGSSEQGFIMVRPVAFDASDGNLALFAHELAHGWWGNRVDSAGPGAMLLSEGLAQFSAVVAIEAIEGEEGMTGFLRFSRPGYVTEQCARGYFQMWRDGKDQALATIEEGGDAHFLADSKGHWVLQMLRRQVGDERFFGVLRDVVRDFAAAPLTLPELRTRLERAAPDADLPRFFADWLDRTGAPILEHDWTAAGAMVRVHVRQTQPGTPYRLPLEIAVASAAARRVHAVVLDGREASFELPCDGAPTGVELDPRHQLLIWTAEYGEKPTE